MKLEINKVVECIASISEDKFYLKSYAKEIIERYCNEQNTELLKQNEALVECLKDMIQIARIDSWKDSLNGRQLVWKQANELLNTLNK